MNPGFSVPSRRQFLTWCGAAVPWGMLRARADEPTTIDPVAADWAADFDKVMEDYMSPRNIPGGALAVIKDGKLVFAKGYGWADRDKKLPVKPDSLFRIASISKPITAAGVMKMVESGKLKLDDKAFEILNLQPVREPGEDPDPRLATVTIRQCLQHTGGWDRDQSGDPMFLPALIAQKTGTPPPAGPDAIIRYMLGQTLDFQPGEHYAYSNFGYCVLGRVIEKLSGQAYDAYIQERILKPAGIQNMRLGATRESGQAPGEVKYYMPDHDMANSVFPEVKEKVLWPYGGFYAGAMDAHGGWISSAVGLMRFAAALDDPARSPLLKPETIAEMVAPPPAPVSRKTDGSLGEKYYACGWDVRPQGHGGHADYTHNGSLPGTFTIIMRRGDGISFAALFNQRSSNPNFPDPAILNALHKAADSVRHWPPEDLFPKWP